MVAVTKETQKAREEGLQTWIGEVEGQKGIQIQRSGALTRVAIKVGGLWEAVTLAITCCHHCVSFCYESLPVKVQSSTPTHLKPSAAGM